MKILVTGANGFVGKNLCARLETIREGKDHTHPELSIDEIYKWDRTSRELDIIRFCSDSDFVFNLAGINRPDTAEKYIEGNELFTASLLSRLEQANNTCPVMLSSSIQASLMGRFQGSAYGRSKFNSEQSVFEYAERTQANVYVYRFPNIFGKWCKPNYNSVVATFCNNIAHDLPIQINNDNTELELLYIDDLVEEMLTILSGSGNRCEYDGDKLIPDSDGKYCYVPCTHKITLGKLADLLYSFNNQPKNLIIPEQAANSFEKKLFATYLSYLPKEKVSFPLKMNIDKRGSFTELLKTENFGQFSVNITKPGITKGQHWHNTKWEFFIVVAGHGLIQERKIGTEEVIEFEVSGEHIEAVHMLPGYTHNIINISKTEDLITVMWANELFEQNHPDTFYEEV